MVASTRNRVSWSKAVGFGFAFTGAEFVVYVISNSLLVYLTKSFTLEASLQYGFDSGLWRVLYLQLVLQVGVLSVVRIRGHGENALAVILAVLASFAFLELVVGASAMRLVKQFWIDTSSLAVGEGLLLTWSATLAWTLMLLGRQLMGVRTRE